MSALRRFACGGAAVVLAGALLAAAATAGQPKHRYTAAGNAAAQAIALRVSDFSGGWNAAKGGGGNSVVTCKTFDPDQSDLTTVGHADTAFTSGSGDISSIVGIFASTAQAKKSWSRFVKPQLLDCMASFLEGSATKGTSIKVSSKGPLRLSVPGKRKAAYRIVADFTAGKDHVRVYLDVILQGRGPANTVLIMSSLVRAPSAALERSLAKAIAARLPT